jgi:PAS domain S-box-containing protein
MIDNHRNNLDSEIIITPKNSEKKNYHIENYIFLIILLLTYLTIFYNYLLFHTIVELFSIVIGGGIFIICWNSRKRIDNSFFLVIGVSFLYIGFLDFVHSLAYTGMNIFTGYDTNLPTQLWIAARYTQAGSFLLASLVINKKIKINYLIIFYTLVTFILLVLIFSRLYPDCFIEGKGLTPFKIISEYIIDLLLFITIFIIYKQRFLFERRIYLTLFYSIIATIIAEILFTLYIHAYGIPNLIGHIFKIVSFFFLYKAIINIGLENPINLLFRKLKLSEKNLIAKANDLERANILLKEAELRYRTTFEQSPDGIVILDPISLKAFEFNNEICHILGYKREEFANLSVPEYDVNEEPEDTMIHVNNILREGRDDFETKFITKNGEIKDIYIRAKVIKLSGKTYFQSICRDITEKKKAEDRLKRLISTVSHELRTPITVLLMSMDYLKNYDKNIQPDVEAKLLEGIDRNVKLLHKLADDILMISRIDEERVKIDWIEYYPLEIINNILTLMEPIGTEKNLAFEIDIPKNLVLKGDPKRIDQIFRIFIDNAIKYSKKSSTIEIKAFDDYKGKYNTDRNNGVLFQFKDNGIGISDGELPHIFERFYRSKNVSETPGSGLGLSIAEELIQLHKGKVYVESKLNEGSIFYIFFPRLNHS